LGFSPTGAREIQPLDTAGTAVKSISYFTHRELGESYPSYVASRS